MLLALIREVLSTIRSLRKAPGFATVAVLTIGLGIGATTLVFSVVFGVLLQPLPYRNPDRLVNVWNDLIEERQFLPVVHPADFRDYQAVSETFEEFAAASGSGMVGLAGVLTDEGPPLHVDLSPVTHNFFSLLGVDPILGRHFTEDEEALNGPKVAMLSNELWSSRYGRDRDIVGRSIQIDGQAFNVVGVLPRGFRLLLPSEAFLIKHSDIWVPLQINYDVLPPRNFTLFTVFGRLKPDVPLARAQAEMDRIAETLRDTHQAHATSGMQIRLVPLRADIVKKARTALLTMFGAVGFVLLIACANVAHLLLLRGVERQKELALRAALGASRSTIVRQVFAESMVIGSLGAALGLVLTFVGLSVLTTLQPPNLPRLTELRMSGPVFGFAALSALVTAIVFGLAPAYHASRTDVNRLLKVGGRTGRSKGPMRVRNVLVVGEVAFSLVLLVGAGLLLRSFQALHDVRPGFEPEGALTFRISLPRNNYPSGAEIQNFYNEIHARIASLSGVEIVGAVNQLPFTGTVGLWSYAYDEETAKDFNLTADLKVVTPDYFDAMGARLLAGRFFSSQDNLSTGDTVIIVEEMLARRAWPNGDAIGQHLQIGPGAIDVTVVGVVEHIRIYDLKQDVREHMYFTHGQAAVRDMSLVVRTSIDPLAVAAAVRDEIWAVDDKLPIDDLRPLSAYVADEMAQARFTLMLMTVFGGLALILTSVGVYGVISYGVDQRSHEFGIRLALGANPRDLVRSVLHAGVRLLAVSVCVGLLAALALARVMEGLLFDVSTVDPWTYAVVASVLTGVAMLACYVPARKTSRADPMATLKAD